VPVAGDLLRRLERAIEAVRDEGERRVRVLQPFVRSNSRRPTTNTPVWSSIVRMTRALASLTRNWSSGWVDGISTSPLPYHWKSRSKPDSPGPAM
jgi:hypothetical protein